eukprot:2470401-Amphidinium_carterae.1
MAAYSRQWDYALKIAPARAQNVKFWRRKRQSYANPTRTLRKYGWPYLRVLHHSLRVWNLFLEESALCL